MAASCCASAESPCGCIPKDHRFSRRICRSESVEAPTESNGATGGSAASQADSLSDRSWTPRPGLSLLIRVGVVLIPAIAGALSMTLVMSVVSRPRGWFSFALWLLGLIAVSVVAARAVQRRVIRFAPMAMVFQFSLVFPDNAPSRFRSAIRAMSGRQLVREVEAKSVAGPEQAMAENLLDLVLRLSRHDRLTRGHSERVRAFSVMLGEEIGLSHEELVALNWAALIHDIGKITVPATILNKDGRPDADEWQILRGHPGAAAPYIEPLRPWLGDWVDAATQHHERWDGGGYPRGLAREQISLGGRIVAIADAYDVMTAARSYKKPLPAAQARAELVRNAGTQFDPSLVHAFIRISVPESRWVLGPAGGLAHLPDLIRAPLTVATASGATLTTVLATSVAAVSGFAATEPAPTSPPAAVERSAEDNPELVDSDLDPVITITTRTRPDTGDARTTPIDEATTTTAPNPTTTTTTPTA